MPPQRPILSISRGNVGMDPPNDSIDLSGIPDEIVVGQFASSGQYDAAVLVGGSGSMSFPT